MNQKGFASVALVVLVIVLVGVFGYITLVRKPASVEQPQQNNLQNTQPTPLPSNNTVSQNSQAMVGWKIYKNDKPDFELSYPSDWNVVRGEGGNYASFFSPDSSYNEELRVSHFVIYWNQNTSHLSLQQWVANNLTATNKSEIEIDGQKVIRFRRPENGFPETQYPVQYVFLNDSKDIVIQLETEYKEESDMSAVISSFKFIK